MHPKRARRRGPSLRGAVCVVAVVASLGVLGFLSSSNDELLPDAVVDKPVDSVPGWLQTYLDTPHSQLLNWKCHPRGSCGGIGDRLNGILQAFYMAVGHERRFSIDWSDPTPLSNWLEPNLLNWEESAAKQYLEPDAVLQLIDQRNHSLMMDPSMDRVEVHSNLFLGEDIIREAFPAMSDTPNLKRLAFKSLFRWSHAVNQRYQKLLQESRIGKPPFLAVHVRLGKGSTWKDPARLKGRDDLRQIFECAQRVQRRFGRPMYVASDHVSVQQHWKDWMSKEDSFHWPQQHSAFHVDKSRIVGDSYETELSTWAEFKLLSSAECLVLSYSKFGELASDLSTTQCRIYWDDCDTERIDRALAKLG